MWRLEYSPSAVQQGTKKPASQLAGPRGRDSITLSRGEFIVGRGANANVEICKDNTLSRQHATVRLVNEGFKAEDRNSPHFTFEIHDGVYIPQKKCWKPSQSGTFVNNVRLDGHADQWVRIEPGASVRFSRHTYVASPLNLCISHSKIPANSQKERIVELAQDSGIYVVRDACKATHLIMVQVYATPKAVTALALGHSIVNLTWLEDLASFHKPHLLGSSNMKPEKKGKIHCKLPSVHLARYRPPLARDAKNMKPPPMCLPTEKRRSIFRGDTFLMSRAERSPDWLQSVITGCGGTISYEIPEDSVENIYVVGPQTDKSSSKFYEAAITAGAHDIKLSVLASAVLRAVPITHSMDMYIRNEKLSQVLENPASSISFQPGNEHRSSPTAQEEDASEQSVPPLDTINEEGRSLSSVAETNKNPVDNGGSKDLDKADHKHSVTTSKVKTASEGETDFRQNEEKSKTNVEREIGSDYEGDYAENVQERPEISMDSGETGMDENAGSFMGRSGHEDSDCACLGGEVGDYGPDDAIPDSFKRPHANTGGVKWLNSRALKRGTEISQENLSFEPGGTVFEPITISRRASAAKRTSKTARQNGGKSKPHGRGKSFMKQHFQSKPKIPYADFNDFQVPLSGQYIQMRDSIRDKEARDASTLSLFSGGSSSTSFSSLNRRRASKRQRR